MFHELSKCAPGWMGKPFEWDCLGADYSGPIVITATFVGYMLYGLIGAVVATVSVFCRPS
jgi:chromate transporter